MTLSLYDTEIAELYVVISFAVVSGHRRDCVIAFRRFHGKQMMPRTNAKFPISPHLFLSRSRDIEQTHRHTRQVRAAHARRWKQNGCRHHYFYKHEAAITEYQVKKNIS